ncbi:hypothetical protein NC653_013304 [Populus alba x Populus x berolinensis]|uniref:Uncharacterized protein n=1 Tax=Populus alba x Populus x berolinensis TaxID=444605 RepID=A0AAD6QUA6_9ROSI|nr:hypothetical protein NC653_013304 [Populus alba x Populus x berolinensis]
MNIEHSENSQKLPLPLPLAVSEAGKSLSQACGDFPSQLQKLFCRQLNPSTLYYFRLCIYARSSLICFHHKSRENEFCIHSVCNLRKDGHL